MKYYKITYQKGNLETYEINFGAHHSNIVIIAMTAQDKCNRFEEVIGIEKIKKPGIFLIIDNE